MAHIIFCHRTNWLTKISAKHISFYTLLPTFPFKVEKIRAWDCWENMVERSYIVRVTLLMPWGKLAWFIEKDLVKCLN